MVNAAMKKKSYLCTFTLFSVSYCFPQILLLWLPSKQMARQQKICTWTKISQTFKEKPISSLHLAQMKAQVDWLPQILMVHGNSEVYSWGKKLHIAALKSLRNPTILLVCCSEWWSECWKQGCHTYTRSVRCVSVCAETQMETRCRGATHLMTAPSPGSTVMSPPVWWLCVSKWGTGNFVVLFLAAGQWFLG